MSKYRRNYLSNVIFRIDYDQEKELNKTVISSIEELLSSLFKLERQAEQFAGKFNINTETSEATAETQKLPPVYVFSNSSKTKRIEVASNYVAIEFTKYTNSEETIKIANNFLEKILTDILDVKTYKRVGLRYINQVNFNKKMLTTWKNYIRPELVAFNSLDSTILKDTNFLSSVTNVEFMEEDYKVLFKYGIWNPNYPSLPVSDIFILDIDASVRLPVSADDKRPSDLIIGLKSLAEKIFESSIKGKLRTEMSK